MSTPESKVKRWVDNVFKKYDCWYFSPQSGPWGKAGIPDRIACVGGFFIGVEVKADHTKKPTELQLRCIQQIKDSGGYAMVVNDKETLSELETLVKKLLGV